MQPDVMLGESRPNNPNSPIILYFSYLVGLGGGETSLVALVKALDRSRFAPRVVCPAWGPLPARLKAVKVPVHVIPFTSPRRFLRILPILSITAAGQTYDLARKQNTALIHVNDFESLVYTGPVARLLGIPLVWTCNGWWNAGGWLKSLFIRLFADQVIAVSEAVQHGLLAVSPGLPKGRVTTIPLGVNLDTFRPLCSAIGLRSELGLPETAPIVTTVGRFHPVKGHRDFLAAVSLIREHWPETHFLVVGDNTFNVPEEELLKYRLQEQVLGDSLLRGHVHFTGFRDDIPAILSLSDVVVCASAFESFGMVNIEAMACGTPVVSTNVGGPAETVLDGKTGFLVPPHRPSEIADRVCRLLADPLLRGRMGQQARQWVAAQFSLRGYVERIEILYARLLDG